MPGHEAVKGFLENESELVGRSAVTKENVLWLVNKMIGR
jgi:hypothetical protein